MKMKGAGVKQGKSAKILNWRKFFNASDIAF